MKTRFKGTKGIWKLDTKTPTIYPNVKLKTPENKSLVISVFLFDNNKSNSTSKESIANAVLVSKSFEMLKMLEEINGYLKTSSSSESAFTLKNKVSRLIKEATEI